MRTIVWFRGKDLRIADHAPLTDAARTGEVIPLFVLDPYFFAKDRAKTLPNRIQFLLSSLRSLEKNVAAKGSRLIVVEGRATEVVPRLAAQWHGEYARRWVPELAKLPAKFIHKPREVPADVLRAAGVSLGRSYPRPIVDHKESRERFLSVAKQHLQAPVEGHDRLENQPT